MSEIATSYFTIIILRKRLLCVTTLATQQSVLRPLPQSAFQKTIVLLRRHVGATRFHTEDNRIGWHHRHITADNYPRR